MKRKKKNNTARWDKERLEQMGEHADALNPVVNIEGKKYLTMQPDRAKVHVDRYKFVNSLVTGRNILDCPCGFGYGSKILDHDNYTGFDISETAISYAIAKYGSDKASFYLADATIVAEQLPDLNQVDTVISIEGIEHVFHPEKMLENFHRWTSKQLIISYPQGWGINAEIENGKRVGGGYHVIATDTNMMTKMLENVGFKIKNRYCMDNEANVYPFDEMKDVQLPCGILDCEKI